MPRRSAPRDDAERPELKPASPLNANVPVPISSVLQQLHDEMPADNFTLGWLIGGLRKRSFGIVMLLLALVAMAPGVCIAAGLLLMIPACQMILGHAAPAFPHRIAAYPFPARHLTASVQRAVPVLRYLEKMTHARWQKELDAAGRLVGVIVLLLSVVMVGFPIPMSNVVPALLIALISLAWLEEDGLLLAVALLAAVLVLALVVAVVCEAVRGAEWISRFW